MEHRDFLLEINVEELPAGYVRDAAASMKTAFRRGLDSFHVGFNGRILDFGTKNSLVCYIENLPLKQEEVSQEILGPPKRIAFDEKGNPTKQAVGFAKNQGVKTEDLKVRQTPKGEYVVIEKKEKARDTKDILREMTPGIIKGIRFPKTMKWDDSGLRFARPIESVLALFGNEDVDIKIDSVPQKKIRPVAPAKYLKTLGKLIDWDVRKKEIKGLILGVVKGLRADHGVDENLLDEVTFMVTSPDVFAGEFDKKFLDLPGDVLRASMAKHQRVFPVSRNGKLINKFIAVLDGRRNKKLVRKVYENILEAKLKDSLFFFDEDTKRPLSENIFQLKDLIFQKDLGNMFEKIERLKALCGFICDKVGERPLKKDSERAAELSKADLVTHMVGEFPSLQGVMGGEYALKSGENKTVAQAVREHYLPQGMDDPLPETRAGAILALMDKIDNVVGFSGMGAEKISGSFDPFGIRRNALGFVRIVKDKGFRFDCEDLIHKAIELYRSKLNVPGNLKDKVVDYLKDRIEFLMGDVRPLELKRAVWESGCFDICDIFNRIRALASIKDKTYFLEAAKVVERTGNILKGAKKEKIGAVDERLFKEDPERSVWKAYLDSKDKIQGLIDEEQYKDATGEYARAFYRVVHDFFDKVLVNVEDRALRLNRLAIMKAINTLYTERVADLALLPQIVVK